ncbi:AfsR/SARP family transcriptional regulator [Modestobacter roseus]|uniref:DNA-binding SARP family transcriptional activator n=1 Tax=Modestobacter roseus TaxID=1181884 RepID=A0A562IQA3_9ACTN|nr:AfsR/SARP family transcriptional regulator [Modestobacter roseus]MQA34375.1 SARP family transcriptional regulator [Modestobacter roseus]TWH72903.1 DNA-binding SARP family transcriptional activator [Modestobacter roseus]
MSLSVGVLGPVTAWADGDPVHLGGPRHRELLARLVVAHGRVVPVDLLVDALWESPPDGAVAAVRTFVAALRRALEPDRPPRTPPRVLVTEGRGYALRVATDADAFTAAVERAAASPPPSALSVLEASLASWRGPAYADAGDRPWLRPERRRLTELHSTVVERVAAARLDLGRPADAVPDLDAHITAHPWREEGWRLLALALYRSGRRPDALAVLRRARTRLVDELGLDPSEQLAALEDDVLRQAPALQPPDDPWARATASWGRSAGPRARLEATVGLLRSLSRTGAEGLTAVREQRLAAIAAAEELGDPRLTARVVGDLDVPGVWTRSDDPEQAAALVAAAERALPAADSDAVRVRLLTTVAVESRGLPGTRGAAAGREAERLARASGDPALLAAALGGRTLQVFDRCGRAADRDALGAELVELASRHGLTDHLVLGHLVRMQARSARGDLTGAGAHADLLDRLAVAHDRPLVGVFTGGWRALRAAVDGSPGAEEAFRTAAQLRRHSGMPGVEEGLLPLTLACLQVWRGEPVTPAGPAGPWAPWLEPHLLLAAGRPAAAVVAALPDPPPGLLMEALWVLAGSAALAVDDAAVLARARDALAPAAGELAGAGSGMLTAGPVADHLAEWDRRLGAGGRAAAVHR